VKLLCGVVVRDEALVVPEVEVGLGAVVGDEHLAVLERAHRARVDVDVRVELDERDPEAARARGWRRAKRQQCLSPARNDAAGQQMNLVMGATVAGNSNDGEHSLADQVDRSVHPERRRSEKSDSVSDGRPRHTSSHGVLAGARRTRCM
jgi:hypothetical protein